MSHVSFFMQMSAAIIEKSIFTVSQPVLQITDKIILIDYENEELITEEYRILRSEPS